MKKIFFILSFYWCLPAFGQIEVGIEFQAYPTGLIPGIHLEYELTDNSGIQGRIGYNIVRHRDLGVHEDERGGGFGGTLGYRYYFKPNRTGIMLGARCDLWKNEVDWKDNIGTINEVQGTTNVTVLQPTAEIGYIFSLKKGLIFLPTVSLGGEINIQTEGAEVGQGAILLLGATIAKRF